MKIFISFIFILTSAYAQVPKEVCQNLKLKCGDEIQNFDNNPNSNGYTDLEDSSCVARIDLYWRDFIERYHVYVVAGDQSIATIRGSVTNERNNTTHLLPDIIIPFQKDVPFKIRNISFEKTCVVFQ